MEFANIVLSLDGDAVLIHSKQTNQGRSVTQSLELDDILIKSVKSISEALREAGYTVHTATMI